MGFSMGSDPLKRPVNHQGLMSRHGANHGVGFFECAGEGFFDDEMNVERGDFFDPLAVMRCCGAQDNHIGFRFGEAVGVVSEDAVARDSKFSDDVLHPSGLGVANAHEFGFGMSGRHPEQVAHMEVVEIEASDAPLAVSHKMLGEGLGLRCELTEGQTAVAIFIHGFESRFSSFAVVANHGFEEFL